MARSTMHHLSLSGCFDSREYSVLGAQQYHPQTRRHNGREYRSYYGPCGSVPQVGQGPPKLRPKNGMIHRRLSVVIAVRALSASHSDNLGAHRLAIGERLLRWSHFLEKDFRSMRTRSRSRIGESSYHNDDIVLWARDVDSEDFNGLLSN
jgi:hypothetical protein